MAFSSQVTARSQIDALKSTTIALPIISSTINTNAIDTEIVSSTSSGGFPALEEVSFLATTTSANANSGNAAVISVQLQHSNVNTSANFVNVPGTGPININSVNALYPATTLNLATPDTLLQFVRLQVQQTAGGQNSANAANITFSLGL